MAESQTQEVPFLSASDVLKASAPRGAKVVELDFGDRKFKVEILTGYGNDASMMFEFMTIINDMSKDTSAWTMNLPGRPRPLVVRSSVYRMLLTMASTLVTNPILSPMEWAAMGDSIGAPAMVDLINTIATEAGVDLNAFDTMRDDAKKNSATAPEPSES